jgi:hypothetical protein
MTANTIASRMAAVRALLLRVWLPTVIFLNSADDAEAKRQAELAALIEQQERDKKDWDAHSPAKPHVDPLLPHDDGEPACIGLTSHCAPSNARSQRGDTRHSQVGVTHRATQLSLDAPSGSDSDLSDHLDEHGQFAATRRSAEYETPQQEVLAAAKRLYEAVEEVTAHNPLCHACGQATTPHSFSSVTISADGAASIVCKDCASRQAPTNPQPTAVADWQRDLTETQRQVWDLHKQRIVERDIAAQLSMSPSRVHRVLSVLKRKAGIGVNTQKAAAGRRSHSTATTAGTVGDASAATWTKIESPAH